jgi:2-polyprenyl-3-methyl-5-hydroxy-6-metoxy-1,4-benzoquinol methylase
VFDWRWWRARFWWLEPSRTRWQRRWNNPAYTPVWHYDGRIAEPELIMARGWITPPAAILDVGCGDGMLSIRLAELGFDVTGIDFSEAAIARASDQARGRNLSVRFETCDVTRRVPSGPFDIVFDRGCFHALSHRHARRYAATLAAACAPGTQIVLVVPARAAGGNKGLRHTEAELWSKIRRVLPPAFAIRDEIVLERSPTRCTLAARLERT